MGSFELPPVFIIQIGQLAFVIVCLCSGAGMRWCWNNVCMIFSLCALLSIKHWMRRINDPSGVDF